MERRLQAMDDRRRRIVLWVGGQVMPHEGDVRLWLRKSRVPEGDIDDLIQEAYCRMAALDSVEHIARPAGYFFQIVRNLLIEQIRRSRVVRFDTAVEIEAFPGGDEASPERITAARRELERVQSLMADLPDRCRRIVELRKIHGMSQRDIARTMGVSESIVENDCVKGLRLILKGLRNAEPRELAAEEEKHERPRNRR